MRKPILCLDFDGVLHSYSSGWKGADTIPDPPVPGGREFILRASEVFDVQVYSSRSGQAGGINAMQAYLIERMALESDFVLETIGWPDEKPAAMITLDDRAVTFDGSWPDIATLKAFQPWNKRPLGATGQAPQGQISDDDEGELKLGVAYDKINGLVRIDFGKPVAWLAMPPSQAIELANVILRNAGLAAA